MQRSWTTWRRSSPAAWQTWSLRSAVQRQLRIDDERQNSAARSGRSPTTIWARTSNSSCGDACVNILAVTKGAVYICMSSSELHTLQKAFSGGWRPLVHVRDLSEEHLHHWAVGLPAAVRAHPLWLERRDRSLLVWRSRPGRRLVREEACGERSAPDNEASRTGGARRWQ